MPTASDQLLRDGLTALGQRLPAGYRLNKSSLAARARSETWIVLHAPDGRKATCLVLARRRVEARDVRAIEERAANHGRPTLVLSVLLAPAVRERLHRLGIGGWDLAGNTRIALPAIGLVLTIEGAPQASMAHKVRSFGGELAGRLARSLIDLPPPFSAGALAKHAQVDPGYTSRALALLVEDKLVVRNPRGDIVATEWPGILQRWLKDTPPGPHLAPTAFVAPRGPAAVVARLRATSLLHAITGAHALARLTGAPTHAPLLAYVDDVASASGQLGLHPCDSGANVILIRPTEPCVFQRATESDGLCYVSPGWMLADLHDDRERAAALAWMATHENSWRLPSIVTSKGSNPSRRASSGGKPSHGIEAEQRNGEQAGSGRSPCRP
jgi:hypothetical protein